MVQCEEIRDMISNPDPNGAVVASGSAAEAIFSTEERFRL